MHITACQNRPFSPNDILLTKTPQTNVFLLPVMKMYLNTVSLFSYDPVNKKETFCFLRRNQRSTLSLCTQKAF